MQALATWSTCWPCRPVFLPSHPRLSLPMCLPLRPLFRPLPFLPPRAALRISPAATQLDPEQGSHREVGQLQLALEQIDPWP